MDTIFPTSDASNVRERYSQHIWWVFSMSITSLFSHRIAYNMTCFRISCLGFWGKALDPMCGHRASSRQHRHDCSGPLRTFHASCIRVFQQRWNHIRFEYPPTLYSSIPFLQALGLQFLCQPLIPWFTPPPGTRINPGVDNVPKMEHTFPLLTYAY